MKIYFAVSVRAGRNDAPIYPEIIKLLKKYGEVLSERNGDPSFHGEINMTDKEIFDRDMDWLRSADVLVAEVTTPSLGVGYEIAAASNIRKPVLCLYRKVQRKNTRMVKTRLYRGYGQIYFFEPDPPGRQDRES